MTPSKYSHTDYPGQWITEMATAESDDRKAVFVTGRCDVDKFRNNPRYSIRITVSLAYDAAPTGMPAETSAPVVSEVTDRLVDVFHRDPVAVITGIYTGDGQRTIVFYAVSTHIFQRKFNEALADLPLLPITIEAENDPDWDEYAEMLDVLETGD